MQNKIKEITYQTTEEKTMEEYLTSSIETSRKKRDILLKQLEKLEPNEHSSRAMIYAAIAKTHETEEKAEKTLQMFRSLRSRRTI